MVVTLLPMLIGMTERGPDSAGLAVYTSAVGANERKFSLYAFEEDFNWQKLGHDFQQHLGSAVTMVPVSPGVFSRMEVVEPPYMAP